MKVAFPAFNLILRHGRWVERDSKTLDRASSFSVNRFWTNKVGHYVCLSFHRSSKQPMAVQKNSTLLDQLLEQLSTERIDALPDLFLILLRSAMLMTYEKFLEPLLMNAPSMGRDMLTATKRRHWTCALAAPLCKCRRCGKSWWKSIARQMSQIGCL